MWCTLHLCERGVVLEPGGGGCCCWCPFWGDGHLRVGGRHRDILEAGEGWGSSPSAAAASTGAAASKHSQPANCTLCCVSVLLVRCSSYVYLLNVTIAGIYNKGYPGTNQALKVCVVAASTFLVAAPVLQLVAQQSLHASAECGIKTLSAHSGSDCAG